MFYTLCILYYLWVITITLMASTCAPMKILPKSLFLHEMERTNKSKATNPVDCGYAYFCLPATGSVKGQNLVHFFTYKMSFS